MKKWKTISIMIIAFLLLTGCQGTEPEKELFTIFERAAEVEKDFAAYSQKIVELEQREAELYKRIIQDGKNSNDNVQSKIKDANESIIERKSFIEKQYQLITASYEETAGAEEFISEIEEQTAKEKAQQVQKLFSKRFEAFIEFKESYQLTIQMEKQLYADLKNEAQDLGHLETKISELNEEFSRNVSLQRKFYDLSSQLNEAKRKFYQEAEIPIA